MRGKVVLITGATSGIGKVAALELAKKGASVVIVGRNAEKTRQVRDEINTQSSGQPVEMLLGDLSIQDDVRRVAAEFRAQHDRLDVLINNAGGLFMTREESTDGLEMTFALNHMSYFLLTHLLLDLLKASAPARVINTSSGAHSMVRSMNFDDLQAYQHYSGWQAYSQSKLANILFTRALAQRLEDTGVTVNALHPGFVNTGFAKNNSGMMMGLFKLLGPLISRSPEKGAETLIYLASSPEVEGISGKYFLDKHAAGASSAAQDTTQAERLWAVSEQLAGTAQPAAAN